VEIFSHDLGGEKKIGTDRARGVKRRFKEEIQKD
jgi:hypothetical protein